MTSIWMHLVHLGTCCALNMNYLSAHCLANICDSWQHYWRGIPWDNALDWMTMLLNVAYVEEPGDVESWLGIVHIGIILFWIVLPNWSLESRVVVLYLVLPLCACICEDVFVEALVLHMAPDGHETMALESQLGALWRYVWENSPRKKRCAAWLQKSRWFFWLFHGVSVIFCSLHRSGSCWGPSWPQRTPQVPQNSPQRQNGLIFTP